MQTQPPQLQLAAMKHLGSLPVVLIPLPTAVGLKGSSLALSDRMALLSCAPGTGRAVVSPLAVAGVTHAVPLWQPATAASGVFHSRYADMSHRQQYTFTSQFIALTKANFRLTDQSRFEDGHVMHCSCCCTLRQDCYSSCAAEFSDLALKL